VLVKWLKQQTAYLGSVRPRVQTPVLYIWKKKTQVTLNLEVVCLCFFCFFVIVGIKFRTLHILRMNSAIETRDFDLCCFLAFCGAFSKFTPWKLDQDKEGMRICDEFAHSYRMCP
jgi:hypothetical protein